MVPKFTIVHEDSSVPKVSQLSAVLRVSVILNSFQSQRSQQSQHFQVVLEWLTVKCGLAWLKCPSSLEVCRSDPKSIWVQESSSLDTLFRSCWVCKETTLWGLMADWWGKGRCDWFHSFFQSCVDRLSTVKHISVPYAVSAGTSCSPSCPLAADWAQSACSSTVHSLPVWPTIEPCGAPWVRLINEFSDHQGQLQTNTD